MTNPFRDQEKFMKACDQTVGGEFDKEQFNLYVSLIEEEANELADAIRAHDQIETLDALIDILVVTIGALHSIGVDTEGAWKEVHGSNMAKIDAGTGVVLRREDGKILKPEGWQPPNLKQHLR